MTFENLDVWKTARQLVKETYAMTRDDPALARDFGLVDQVRRAAVSIMSNTAEGFERSHIQEKLQFYNVARGSSAEVRSLLYVIEDNYPDSRDTAVRLRGESNAVGQLVSGLVRSTEKRKRSGILGLLLSFF